MSVSFRSSLDEDEYTSHESLLATNTTNEDYNSSSHDIDHDYDHDIDEDEQTKKKEISF